MIGRPSQPDLDNTSVGKPDINGSREESAAFPSKKGSGFFVVTIPQAASRSMMSANYERISL
jgi:hypothetical protein